MKKIIIDESRPFEPTGMTTALWSEIEPRQINLEELIWCQNNLTIEGLTDALEEESSFVGDKYPHVVRWKDKYYLSDGHHRSAIALIRGQKAIEARIITKT